MIRFVLTFSLFLGAFTMPDAQAAVATCQGTIRGQTISFYAQGSLIRQRDGFGHVKINGRVVARFDGDAARINYVTRSFSIRNDRGDYVEGRVISFETGRSTLTRMTLPGEGIRIVNAPVNCSVR
jgi:hypothetical protein